MKYYKLDRDTKAYLKRMAVDGIKTPADIYSVNDFVVGLKDLNLWGSIIFWPLRSLQNAGFGTTVYSLGGLGAYRATLVGGIWKINGIEFSTSESMFSSINLIEQDFSIFFCGTGTGSQPAFGQYFGLQNSNGFSANQSVIQDDGSGSSLNLQMRNSGSVGYTTNSITKPFSTSNLFTFVSASVQSYTSLFNIRNLRTSTQNTGTYTNGIASLDRMQLNGRWNGSNIQLQNPIIVSFCGYLTPANDGNMSVLYTIYKSTLGKGLALP